MAPILYVETNFAIGIAKGQDPAGAALLEDDFHDVQLVVPSVCFMESLSVCSFEQRVRSKFHRQLTMQLSEIERDLTYPQAKLLARQCVEYRLGSEEQLNHVEARLFETLERLSLLAVKVHPDHDMIIDALNEALIDDPTDNLILSCILRHARSNPTPSKAFVSGNHKDFGQVEVEEVLSSAGVKYFSKIADALASLRSPRLWDTNS